MLYEQVKYNKRFRLLRLDSGGLSGIVILSLPSWVHPSIDALWACVPLSISSHVHILPDVLPWSLCGWPRNSLHLLEEGHNRPIVCFIYQCHMISEVLVFFSFLYFKLLELGAMVEVAFNNRSSVIHNKIILLKSPLWSISSKCTDEAFVLLICFCFFHL